MPICAIQIRAQAAAARRSGYKSEDQKRQRQYVDMGGVVSRGADARPGEIRKHREVGRKEERREQRPRKTAVGVDRERCGEHGCALEPEQ
jgi:hypothetical protein